MSDERNIVITGYMGTGKSAVARHVAERMGRTLVDMDEVIESRVGVSIPAFFRERGEPAFRDQEQALCDELAQQQGLVIATGGGTLVDAHNRQIMGQTGLLVCLDCAPSELGRRLQGDAHRPMLWAENPAARLCELLAERQPAYAQIPYHIDTTYCSAKEAASQVVALYEANPKTWRVRTPSGEYSVHLVPGGLEHIGALLRCNGVQSGVVLVCDENVWPLHGQRLYRALASTRLRAASVVLPAGEQHKTLDTLRLLYDRLAESGLDRSGAVLALGGGVITDMAGLAAATYMRGVHLVMVPTSLLGMVDASIGGKVAVDHPKGKNLIGAFVRPLFVMLDPDTLDTLPKNQREAGLAEVIKASILGDPDLFATFERTPDALPMRTLVERAVAFKIDVVQQDPYERGRRAILNLGHTFAHAFEVLAGYTLGHGLAVSMGIVAAAHLAEIRGICSDSTRRRITTVLERQGLPITYDAHSPVDVLRAMATDKKRQNGRLRFILPRAIGEAIIDKNVTEDEVIASLEKIRP